MTADTKRIRVVIAKPGLDGHDTGAKVVVHALKDAGMEVIYTGLHRSVEDIVKTALEEDADVIDAALLGLDPLDLIAARPARPRQLDGEPDTQGRVRPLGSACQLGTEDGLPAGDLVAHGRLPHRDLGSDSRHQKR